MSNYKLKIKTNTFPQMNIVPLHPDEVLSEESLTDSDIIVYDNVEYSIKVLNDADEEVLYEYCLINDEKLPDNESRPFLDCYGIVKISILIDGDLYTSPPLSVFVKGNSLQNENIEKMIDYIYNNYENYIYDYHSKNNMRNSESDHGEISLEAKINVLERIKSNYKRFQYYFKNSPHTKLINKNKIASFDKLQDITPQTIKHIITHVDEFEPTDINSGIVFNGQNYQPKNTLVKSVHYTQNNYENQCVVAFMKKLIFDLQEMQRKVNALQVKANQYREINGYIESKFFIYRTSRDALKKYSDRIANLLNDFKILYVIYKKSLRIDDIDLKGIPQFTPVFKNIQPYRIIFESIQKWFNSGSYDLSKDELILSFLSTSKIYEYYCLLKLNSAIKNNGFILEKGSRFLYKEDYYYKNSRYNNTFYYKKDDKKLTVFFQPKIFSGNTLYNNTSISNDILLFRNSSFSTNNYNNANPNAYYTPDYIIKVDNDNNSNYWIVDAKFSNENNIKKHQLLHLVWKYLFSISTVNDKDKLSGLIVFCGKTDLSKSVVYNDIHYGTKSAHPTAQLVHLSELNKDNNFLDNSLQQLLL